MKISILTAAFLVAALAQPAYLAARQTPASQFSREMLKKTPILNNEFYLISSAGGAFSSAGLLYLKSEPAYMMYADSIKRSPEKYLRNGILSAYGMGILGALIVFNSATCTAHDDNSPTCIKEKQIDRIGFMAGSTIGSIWSLYKQTNESGTRTFVPIFLGSIVGGIGGYYLSKEINGLIAMLLPPVSAFASLKLIKYEF